MPVVQKRRWVSFPFMPSSRTLYPTLPNRNRKKLLQIFWQYLLIRTIIWSTIRWFVIKLAKYQLISQYFSCQVIALQTGTYRFTQCLPSLWSNSLRNRNCRYSSWLCTNNTTNSSTNRFYFGLKYELRNLCGLATASFTWYNYDL